MRRLLLALALFGCGPKPDPVTPDPVTPCAIAAPQPPPALHATGCGTSVCLPLDEAKLLFKWIAAEQELHDSIAGCPLVRVSK